MNEQDICETAARMHKKLYEFLVMPNGHKCCASIFQQFITEVADDLDFLFVHLDDILVYSETLEQHLRHLEQLFERLNKFGFKINLKSSNH